MQVSVIIPVYNPGRVFEECLSALAKSDNSSFEVIVVDDCSLPGISLPGLSVPAQLIRSEIPLGPGVARNTGARCARGEILLFIDSDIIIEKDTINKIIENFTQDRGLAAVSGFYNYRRRYKNLSSVYHNLYFEYKQNHIQPESPYVDTAIWGIKKEVFVAAGGFTEGMFTSEDLELGIKLYKKGYKLRSDRGIRVEHVKFLNFKGWLRNRFSHCTNMLMAKLKRRQAESSNQQQAKDPALQTILLPQVVSPFLAGMILLMAMAALSSGSLILGNITLLFTGAYLLANISYIVFIFRRAGFKAVFLLPYLLLEHLISLVAVLAAFVNLLLKRPFIAYRESKR